MNNSTRNTLSAFAGIGSKAVMYAGGLLFLFGGRALHEFSGVDRVLAEMEGLGLAVLCFLVGFLIKRAGEDLEVPEEIEDSVAEDEPEKK